jgi:two-component system, OmpR family, response regulator
MDRNSLRVCFLCNSFGDRAALPFYDAGGIVAVTNSQGAAPMRILLVEDHADLAAQIAKQIKNAGFVVDCVGSLRGAEQALDDYPYSATLLDRRLPDGDGLSLIPLIRRRQPMTRVLMLTALDAVDRRIEGLDAGADDYLTKPFNLDEMMARIRASLRRRDGDFAPPVNLGSLSFDLDSRSVSVGGAPLMLHRRELALLEALMKRAGRVVRRETLMTEIYSVDEAIQPHALTILTSRLRSRLDDVGAGVEIHSARGVGYMIAKSKTCRNDGR